MVSVVNNRVQTTLVAFYGPKPEPFSELILLCQQRISQSLKHGFIPYQVAQVHATLVGLEGCRMGDKVVNKNFLDHRGESRLMNFAALLKLLRLKQFPHIGLRIGGYEAGKDFGFDSRGKHPYERSFEIRGEIAVAMGWPIKRSRPLDCLRRSFMQVNVLHKEYRTEADVDDDFYFVLGRVERRDTTDEGIQETRDALRNLLVNIEPVELVLTPETLSIVAYLDTQLPLNTSCAFDLMESSIDGPTLVGLYSAC